MQNTYEHKDKFKSGRTLLPVLKQIYKGQNLNSKIPEMTWKWIPTAVNY